MRKCTLAPCRTWREQCGGRRRGRRRYKRAGRQPCCNVDLFRRCTSCSFFAPTNDFPCLHHQRRTVAFSLLLCAFPSSYPLPPLPISLPLHYPHRFQLAGELIITYHSWRTYPKSKHLTLLIRLMPWGARALAPAACTEPLSLCPPPLLLLPQLCAGHGAAECAAYLAN